jgi:ABC-type transport system involved in multi-copper enzyme maturation permease subunit
MVWQLIIHNLLDNAKSLRFLLSFLIVVTAFMFAGILFVGKYELAIEDVRNSEMENLRSLEQKSRALNQVATHGQALINPAPLLGFVFTGLYGFLPNALYVNAFSVGGLGHLARVNFLLPRFSQLDWVFIIGILLSFVALALTFDAVSQEKEDGTLRLVMTNAFPKYQFVLAKYAGSLLVLLIPLTVGVLLNLVIIHVVAPVILSPQHWLQILFVFGVSVLYLSIFALVGLSSSILTNHSSSSMVLGLIFWVCMVLIVPNLGKLISETFLRVATSKQLMLEIDLARDNVTKGYGDEAHIFIPTDRYRASHRQRAQMLSEVVEVEAKLRAAHRAKQVEQVRWGQNWTRVSPTAVYQYSVESIANVGISRFLKFNSDVNDYRAELLEFVKRKDALDTQSPHWLNPAHDILYSNSPVDAAEVPRFQYRPPDFLTLSREAAMDILLLVLMNVVLFSLCVVLFLRFDVTFL